MSQGLEYGVQDLDEVTFLGWDKEGNEQYKLTASGESIKVERIVGKGSYYRVKESRGANAQDEDWTSLQTYELAIRHAHPKATYFCSIFNGSGRKQLIKVHYLQD